MLLVRDRMFMGKRLSIRIVPVSFIQNALERGERPKITCFVRRDGLNIWGTIRRLRLVLKGRVEAACGKRIGVLDTTSRGLSDL